MTSHSDKRGESLTYLTNIAVAFDPVEGDVQFDSAAWTRIRNAIFDLSTPSHARENVLARERALSDGFGSAPSTTRQSEAPPPEPDEKKFLDRLLCQPIDGIHPREVHRLLWLAVTLQERLSAASATPRSEPFGWYGTMSNGDGTESPRFESGAKPWCLKDMRDAKPLYLRLPLNLGEPINHARLEAILWRWGTGTVTLDCDDQGRFRLHVEHAEAADEVYVHADQEGVLDAAIAATANNSSDGGKA